MATAKTPASNPADANPALVPNRSSDALDHNLGWTVQHGTPFETTDAIPGQVFVKAQLPNPALQVAAGIDPAGHGRGLVVVSDEEAKNHPGGPEPHDPLAGTAVYAGTSNAGTRTTPDETPSPAVTSTVPNIPA